MTRLLIPLLLVCFSVIFSNAQVKLPSIVSDGMVLQRNEEIKIWGWASKGEKVNITFNNKTYSIKTGKDGKWQIVLDPMKAGGPYSMEITASNTIELKNILIGDVWLCSGQSNMTHNFGRHQERYAKEIASSEDSEIRQFYVPTQAVLTGPIDDTEGLTWQEANPESLLKFTVIGYFHAKTLYDKYKVPMGIINTCVGGTTIEAWTSEDGFKEFPNFLEIIEKNKDTAYVNGINREAKEDRLADGPNVESDKGLIAEIPWYKTEYKPLNWKTINIPGYWEDQGVRNLDGVVWYRKEINVPEHMTGTQAVVKLGRIVDADKFYINGEHIGTTWYQYPQREYTIEKGILKPGKNLFVVRVVNQHNKGGFIPDKPYFLLAANDTIDLKGTWEYKVGEVYSHDKKYKQGISAQSLPTSLYNGMIAPYTNYAIRGILWYQGESNANNPELYSKLLPNLIHDWRKHWLLGDIPFLIAQLPNFMDVDYSPAESQWAEMRQIQLNTALNAPNTGLGINIDLGEWNDIHPGNKKPVGERLAMVAMNLSYGEKNMICSGPVYDTLRIEGNKIILTFNHVGSGLIPNNGEELAHFAIAGADKKFLWAEASIVNNEVVVWCNDIPEPKYVRYAWADNPDFANLANKEGLPASPFTTE